MDLNNKNTDDGNIVFIPLNVPSSKNSKVATSRGVFNSKLVQIYLRGLGVKSYSVSKKTIEYKIGANNAFPEEQLKLILSGEVKPAVIGLHFVRKDSRKFDFHNISQIIFDLLVAARIIEDDDMSQVIPVPLMINGRYYSINKESPGVIVKAFNLSNKDYPFKSKDYTGITTDKDETKKNKKQRQI